MKSLITFVPDYYPSNTGFAQAFMHLHESILKNKKCDHVYVFYYGEGKSPDENITFFPLKKIKGMRILPYHFLEPIKNMYFNNRLNEVYDKIRTIASSSEVQMILVESMFMAWIIPYIRKEFPDIPVVCRIHGTGPEYTAYLRTRKETKFNDFLLDCVFKSKYIAATTKFYFDFFRDYYHDYNRFYNREFFLLPNTSLPAEGLSGFENNTKKERIVLLQLGTMDIRGIHQKGFQDTIKALMYIEETDKEVAGQIEYITIGAGAKESDIVKQLEKLKVVKQTHYSRLPNNEVKEIEAKSDVILLPSRCEGMSMFATEAIASGKPLICTQGNGLEAVCKDGYNGLMMTEYNYITYSEHIKKLVTDDELRRTMSINSKRLYDSNCSYEVVADKYSVITKFVKE